MKIFILVFISLFTISCAKSYNVGLYKDTINKDGLLAVFPSSELEVAINNCQSTVDLYKVDDQKNHTISLVTGIRPVYYCQEITNSLFYSYKI